MPEDNKRETGLKNHTIVLMVCTAFFFDVLQALLSYILLGWLMIPIGHLTFIVWFKMHGVKYWELKTKKVINVGVGTALEILTAGILPAFTFMVLRAALDERLKKIAPGLDIIKK